MTIDERVANLEQKSRRLTIAMIALFCGLALVVGLNVSISVNKLVQTREDLAALRRELRTTCTSQAFVLLDENQNRLGSLTTSNGHGSLTLMDGRGNPRIVARAGEDEPSLKLLAEDGRPQIVLSLDPDGNRLLIHASRPNSKAAIQTAVNGSGPILRLLGEEGEEVAPIPPR